MQSAGNLLIASIGLAISVFQFLAGHHQTAALMWIAAAIYTVAAAIERKG